MTSSSYNEVMRTIQFRHLHGIDSATDCNVELYKVVRDARFLKFVFYEGERHQTVDITEIQGIPRKDADFAPSRIYIAVTLLSTALSLKIMSQYAAQVTTAVEQLKLSNTDGTFKALLRDVSDIVRSVLSSCDGSYDSRCAPKRIELTKLNRENQGTDDLKTLLLALGFDDDHQRPSCMIITQVNTNVLSTFLNEAARELEHVEGLTTSFSTFPSIKWPDSKMQEEDTWELPPDDHPQMRVLARYYTDRHPNISEMEDPLKTAAVFSFYFCAAFMSLPVFLRFLHSCGQVDRLCQWLRVAKEQIDKSAVLLGLLRSSTPSRLRFEKAMRKVENFAQYTAFAPNFKEDFHTIREDANGLLIQLKDEMQKSSKQQLLMIYRFSYNLSHLISQVTPLTTYMPLHAPDISNDNIDNFCRSARAIKPFVSPDYEATLVETCTFLSKHTEKLAYDELSSLLLTLAERLIDSMRVSVTSDTSITVPDHYRCSQYGRDVTEQLPTDSPRMVRMLGTATDVEIYATRDGTAMCSVALQLGMSQEEYEEAFHRQLNVDIERQSPDPLSCSEATSPPPLQPRQSHTHSRSDQAKDEVTEKSKREAYTSSKVPLPWPEDDSGLATCEQSSQQVESDEETTFTHGEETACDGKTRQSNGDFASKVPANAPRVATATIGQTASYKRQRDEIKQQAKQKSRKSSLATSSSSSSSSSADPLVAEILKAAPEAFSIAQKATQEMLEEEISKRDEMEELLRSPTSQPLSRARDELQKGIEAVNYKIATLETEVQTWKRLFSAASSLTIQKGEKSVAKSGTSS